MRALRLFDKLDESTRLIGSALKEKRRLKRAVLQKVLSNSVDSKRLSEVAELNPSTLPESTLPGFRFRYLDLGSVDHGTVSWPVEYTQFSGSPSRARRVVVPGDVLLSTVRPTLLGFAHLGQFIGNVVVSTGFAVLRAKDAEDSEFIYQSLFSRPFLKQVEARLAGSSFPAIAPSDVARLRVQWPAPGNTRRRAAAALATLDHEITLLERQLTAYRQLKRGLMQKLLTGAMDLDATPATTRKTAPTLLP